MTFREFFSERRDRFLLWWGVFAVLGLVRTAGDPNFNVLAAIGIVMLAAFLALCMVALTWLRTGRRRGPRS